MRSGWGESGDNPAGFECGNTDRFKAQWRIWISETNRWASTRHPSTKLGGKGGKCRKGGKGKGKSVRYTFLEPNENAIGNGAIPESQANVSNRKVNLSYISG